MGLEQPETSILLKCKPMREWMERFAGRSRKHGGREDDKDTYALPRDAVVGSRHTLSAVARLIPDRAA